MWRIMGIIRAREKLMASLEEKFSIPSEAELGIEREDCLNGSGDSDYCDVLIETSENQRALLNAIAEPALDFVNRYFSSEISEEEYQEAEKVAIFAYHSLSEYISTGRQVEGPVLLRTFIRYERESKGMNHSSYSDASMFIPYEHAVQELYPMLLREGGAPTPMDYEHARENCVSNVKDQIKQMRIQKCDAEAKMELLHERVGANWRLQFCNKRVARYRNEIEKRAKAQIPSQDERQKMIDQCYEKKISGFGLIQHNFRTTVEWAISYADALISDGFDITYDEFKEAKRAALWVYCSLDRDFKKTQDNWAWFGHRYPDDNWRANENKLFNTFVRYHRTLEEYKDTPSCLR